HFPTKWTAVRRRKCDKTANPGRFAGRKAERTESVPQYFDQSLAEARRRRRDTDPGGFHRRDLGFGIALAAGNDGAGMAHAPARRSRAAGDETHHGLLAAAPGLILVDFGGTLLGRAADLADHDDGLGPVVAEEHGQHVDEVGAFHRIAADADRGGLAQVLARRLEHRLVSERAGA